MRFSTKLLKSYKNGQASDEIILFILIEFEVE
jgi:hypothetical protein